MQVGVASAAALASALLLWVASPAVGAGWLAWVALVPAAAAALRSSGARAGRLAVPLALALTMELLLVPSLPFGLARRQWGDPVLPVLVGSSPVLFVALVAVPLFGLLLYALRFPSLGFRSGAILPILAPAVAWTALDLMRTKFDPSGLWGALFLTQADTRAGDLAALAGPWLVTFALVSVNWAVAFVLVRGRGGLAPAAATVVVVAALAAASPLFSGGSAEGGPRVVLAAVQPGYDTAEFDLPVLRYLRKRTRNHELATRDLVNDLTPLTEEAARLGADVVVWPEATAWVEPLTTPSARATLAGLARRLDLAVVVPYFIRSQAQGAAVVVLPSGTITRPQPKQRPMWFLGERGENRVPPQPAAVGSWLLGTMLGVDNQDPGAARALVAAGATVLASSTHDWAELAPWQRAFARIHARALRVPVVRADWRYGSLVVDADGGSVADAGLDEARTVVVGEAAAPGAPTPYARTGDAFGWAAAAAALALLLASSARVGVRP